MILFFSIYILHSGYFINGFEFLSETWLKMTKFIFIVVSKHFFLMYLFAV